MKEDRHLALKITPCETRMCHTCGVSQGYTPEVQQSYETGWPTKRAKLKLIAAEKLVPRLFHQRKGAAYSTNAFRRAMISDKAFLNSKDHLSVVLGAIGFKGDAADQPLGLKDSESG